MLENRVASPHEIAAELGAPLSNTSYHVRRLRTLGLIELVERVVRRGAVEHRYRARFHAIFSDEEWGELPTVAKRSFLGGVLAMSWEHMVAAAEQGGFDRSDIHYSRTAGKIDEQAWKSISRELKATLARVEDIVRESEARVTANGAEPAEDATVILMHFGGPDPGKLSPETHNRLDRLRATGATALRAAMEESG
jgi:hypothetical protein